MNAWMHSFESFRRARKCSTFCVRSFLGPELSGELDRAKARSNLVRTKCSCAVSRDLQERSSDEEAVGTTAAENTLRWRRITNGREKEG